jgi:hypothetical protein
MIDSQWRKKNYRKIEDRSQKVDRHQSHNGDRRRRRERSKK